MIKNEIDIDQVKEQFKLLQEYALARAWRGYGSAIFFEFGDLDDEKKGQYTLTFEQGWQIKINTLTLTYTDENWEELDKQLSQLNNLNLTNFTISNEEIVLIFEKFEFIFSLNDLNNNKWSLSVVEGGYLTCSDGSFVVEKEG